MERHCKMLVVLTLSLVAVFENRAVTYGQECIAPPPCECTPKSLLCKGKQLTKFPVLAKGQEFEILRFDDNEIQSIGDDSFAGLLPKGTSMTIVLDDNQLSYISPTAFRGLENIGVTLDLRGNNLTDLPIALIYLKHIQALSIDRLKFFDPEVMTVIGKSLKALSTGFDGTWPDALNLATNLNYLTLTDSDIEAFPIGNKTWVFRTLRSFELLGSFVNETLDVICHMPALDTLMLDDVKTPPGIPALAPCVSSVKSVTSLTVINSSFSNMSDILRSFPSLSDLSIIQTGLKQVVLPTSNHLEYLNFKSNKLENLPTTDGRSLLVTTMLMPNNLVTVIRAHDLTPFPNLEHLKLGNNPITTIESGAFLHNMALWEVDLSNTRLTAIPVVPNILDRFSSYNFRESLIQCSCAMKWMDPWLNRNPVSGNCANRPMTIEEFIKTELRKCQSPAVIG